MGLASPPIAWEVARVLRQTPSVWRRESFLLCARRIQSLAGAQDLGQVSNSAPWERCEEPRRNLLSEGIIPECDEHIRISAASRADSKSVKRGSLLI